MRTRSTPDRLTAPATFNCVYCVSKIVPAILIVRSLPLAKETELAVASMPALVGLTDAVVPGARVSAPPAVSIDPFEMTTSAPERNVIAVFAGRVMSAETVNAPLVTEPIVSAPATMRSSSESVKPSDPDSLPPTRIGPEACATVTETDPLLVTAPCMSTSAAIIAIVPTPTSIDPPATAGVLAKIRLVP